MPVACAQEESGTPSEAVPIEVTGDAVEFLQQQNKVIGSGNIRIQYEDVLLTCDEVTVWLDTQEVLAKGDVVIVQDDNRFAGDHIKYNFKTKSAEVVGADVNAEPWYGRAEKVSKGERDEYILNKGYVTTCDLDHPHYKLSAKKLKIYPGKWVEAAHVTFYVLDVPVMYLPYFASPIPERVPGITVIPGYSHEWGAYALTSMKYYFNENSNGRIHLDYREKKDFASGIDYNFSTKFAGKGYLKTYYMHERDLQVSHIWDHEEAPTVERQRYRIRYAHRWDIDPGTTVTAEYNNLSDEDIIKDYFFREYEQEPKPVSYVSAQHSDSNIFVSLLYQPRINGFFTQTQKLPQIRTDILSLKLAGTPFYYNSRNSVTAFDREYSRRDYNDEEAVRADTYHEISYPFNVFDFLSLKPFVGSRHTYYSKDVFGRRDKIRGLMDTGFDVTTRSIHRIYDVRSDFLGMDINRLRHIIAPSLSYNYVTKPTVSSAHLFQFDFIDELDHKNFFKLELLNKLQTKREYNGQTNTVDLARFIVTTDYVINRENSENKFDDVDFLLELRPRNGFYIEATSKFDPRSDKFTRVTSDIIARKDDYEFSLGHRYEAGNSTQVTGQFIYNWNDKWKFRTYQRWELKSKDIQEQEYAITKDLHCWLMDIIFNQRENEGNSIWVVFRLKAFPQLPIKISTTYNEPKVSRPAED
jgi:LPS-assembly protein